MIIKDLKNKNSRNSKDIILIEVKLKNKINKELKKTNNKLVKYIKSFDKSNKNFNILNKNIDIQIETIINGGISNILNYIIIDGKKTFKKSNEHLNNELNIGINFNNIETNVNYYFEQLELKLPEQLNNTTITRIKEIIKDGINNGDNYGKIGDEIKLQSGAGVFSEKRAQTISQNEIGKCYEQGKQDTIKKFKEENPEKQIKKRWITVGDNKVTKNHRKNASDGWINNYEKFSGTGDLLAPGNDIPRCRCSIAYKII